MKLRTPRGFQDIMLDEAELRESTCRRIGDFFAQASYRLIETPVAERMDVLAAGFSHEKSPLIDDAFRFVDVDGTLLVLRSDVTLPLARVVATRFDNVAGPYRLRYCTDVFREQEALRGQSRMLTQLGVEFLGAEGLEADLEIIQLALGGLGACGLEDYTLNLNNVSIFLACIEAAEKYAQDGASFKENVLSAAHRGDFVTVRALCDEVALPAELEECITSLPFIRGKRDALDAASRLVNAAGVAQAIEGVKQLTALYNSCELQGLSCPLTLDMSLMPDLTYYTGLVFEIYAPTSPLSLGSGGRYDQMAALMGRSMPGAGFAYNVGRLVAALRAREESPRRIDEVNRLKIAIPKGSLYKGSLKLLEKCGFDIEPLRDPKRQLRILTDELDVIIAKPTDVAIYVANGAVQCGIGGKDILLEADYPLLEMVDLKFGACKFVVAQPSEDTTSLVERALAQGYVRVATKYPRITGQFFEAQGIQAEIVKLNGNIELAPLIGIADVIVDITATGTTLRENNLVVVTDVMDISARFVANPAAMRNNPEVSALAEKLYALTKVGTSCN